LIVKLNQISTSLHVLFCCTEITEFIVFTSQHTVRGIPLNTGQSYAIDAMQPYTEGRSNFVALDVDTHDKYIYFSEVRKDAIYRIHPNGTGTYYF